MKACVFAREQITSFRSNLLSGIHTNMYLAISGSHHRSIAVPCLRITMHNQDGHFVLTCILHGGHQSLPRPYKWPGSRRQGTEASVHRQVCLCLHHIVTHQHPRPSFDRNRRPSIEGQAYHTRPACICERRAAPNLNPHLLQHPGTQSSRIVQTISFDDENTTLKRWHDVTSRPSLQTLDRLMIREALGKCSLGASHLIKKNTWNRICAHVQHGPPLHAPHNIGQLSSG